MPTVSSRDLAIAAAILIAVVGAVIVVAINTGSDTDTPADSTEVTTTSPTTPPTTEPPVPTTVPADVPAAFATNLAARSPAAAQRLVDLSSPGSPAAAYARHQEAALEIMGSVPVGRVEPRANDAVAVCDTTSDGAVCRTFADFVVDEAGLLSGFSIDGVPIGETVLAGGVADIQDTLTVRLISAATTGDDQLVTIFEAVNTGPTAVWLNGFAAVHRSDTGVETEVSLTAGADQVTAGASELFALWFDGGVLGGVVTVPTQSEDFTDTVEMNVPVAAP